MKSHSYRICSIKSWLPVSGTSRNGNKNYHRIEVIDKIHVLVCLAKLGQTWNKSKGWLKGYLSRKYCNLLEMPVKINSGTLLNKTEVGTVP